MLTSIAVSTVVAKTSMRYCPHVLQRFNWTVVAVLFVFLYLYVVTVAFVIVPWLAFSVPGILHLTGLTITTGLALYCYFGCMFIDPGGVPPGWRPDEEHSSVQEVKKKGGAPRYCQKCNQYKPPRSHHCRICQRCILRMDHHCKWVNQCIGHGNYKSFFLLLIYGSAALVHCVVLLLSHALHALQASQLNRVIRTGPQSKPVAMQGSVFESIFLYALVQTVAIALSLPVAITLIMLLVYHVQLLLTNKTTIEQLEGVTAQITPLQGGKRRRNEHPYNVGLCNNLHEVCGDNAAAWLLPPARSRPGGASYPTTFNPDTMDAFL